MILNPDRLLIVAFEWGGPVRHAMKRWLEERFPRPCVAQVNRSDLVVARNSAMRDFVIPKDDRYDWVLVVDNDVEPCPQGGTDAWLNTPGDLVACQCSMGCGPDACLSAWGRPDSFHTTLWFARLDALRSIPLPWFKREYSPDGCEIVNCTCDHLRQKAIAVGLVVANGGWCEHLSAGSWRGQ